MLNSSDDGDIVVLEICPSPFPPVHYKGKTWIRVGSRKAIARVKEELNENGNPEAIFDIHKIGAFEVTIYNAFTESSEEFKSNHELGADDWVKMESRLGEKLGENQIQILKLMHQNPKISIVEISTKLELSTTAIENNIKKLREKNILEHIGPAKGGQWRIIF
jgi:predicted HTH transcriptional regulator